MRKVADNPLPWQKSLDKLTNGRVAISVGWSFSGEQRVAGVPPVVATANPKGDWYTPDTHPNKSGKSPGWKSGKLRTRKNRYPTVKKRATKPRKEPAIAV